MINQMLLMFIISCLGLMSGDYTRTSHSFGPGLTDNLESRVYQWPEHPGSSNVDVRTIVNGGTTHLKSLSIEAVTLSKNQSKDYTAVETERLIILKQGEVSVTLNDQNQETGSGSIALVIPGDHCTIANASAGTAAYYLLEYNSKSPMDAERAEAAGGSFMVDWDQVQYREHSKGGRRDFFHRPTAMCEDFEMHVTNLNQNTSSHDPHTHVVEEIILMVRGTISMHIDGTEMVAREGDFAFIDSNIPHAPTNIGSEQAIYFAFQWK